MVNFVKCFYFWFHVFALETYKGTFVSHLVAVVWSGKDCKALATFLIFIAQRLYFM